MVSLSDEQSAKISRIGVGAAASSACGAVMVEPNSAGATNYDNHVGLADESSSIRSPLQRVVMLRRVEQIVNVSSHFCAIINT